MSRFLAFLTAATLLASPAFAQIVTFSASDCSKASLTGSSQTLVAANSQRRYLYLQNTGNANAGVNVTGGTAAIGGTGTITLAAGASKEYTGTGVPTNAITGIGTAAQPLACIEGR